MSVTDDLVQWEIQAATIEANMRTMEDCVRRCYGGITITVACEVARHVHRDEVGAPQFRWIINLHLEDHLLAQGQGKNFVEALFQAQERANLLLGRCPTCGHVHVTATHDAAQSKREGSSR